MTFEDAMSALGAELGFELAVVDGRVRIEAPGADGDGIVVEMSDMPDSGAVLFSSAIGDVPSAEALKPLLEANHLFGETAGATLSAEDGRLYFERYVPLPVVGRGEGAGVVKAFVACAREWRRRIGGRPQAPGSSVPQVPPGFMQV